MRETFRRPPVLPLLLALATAGAVGSAPVRAQQPGSTGFHAGEPLQLTSNARVYGSFAFTESCTYDSGRDLYVTPSMGSREPGSNDGYVSLVNPDGTVHTLKWIGVTRDGLTLENPLGSDIAGGRLWVADGNHVRSFDLRTGRPVGDVEVPGARGFNDIAAAADGTVYATQTGSADGSTPQRIYRIEPDGSSSVFVDGDPLTRPNGIAFDAAGNIVVVNIGTADVLTFSPEGRLLRTEQSLDAGNDGLVVLSDGTKYVSSVRNGTVAALRPGRSAEMVASGIPSAASMCYDSSRNRLVVPMNSGNALAFVELD